MVGANGGKKHEDKIASAFKFVMLCMSVAIYMKIVILR
jgi:hypothetical protein